MRGSKFVVPVVFVIAVAGNTARSVGQQEDSLSTAARTVPSHGLPASLDALYPPHAREPVYLMHMVELGARMTGVVVDLATQDLEYLASTFAAFEAAYSENAGLVPEWSDRFPIGPVESLGEALTTGDIDKVGPGIAAVGEVCDACHHDTMVAVTQRYHWADANAITTNDPVSGRKVAHAEFMHMLDFSLTGIGHDLAQGQVDSARKHYQEFKSRFVALADTCENCHGVEERFYFTGAVAMARVEAIGSALDATSPDPSAVQGAVMEVGFNTCHRCHLVHVPAAFTKIPAVH